MSELKFQGWGKIPRLNREMVVTEKIDGTQAAIGIVNVDNYSGPYPMDTQPVTEVYFNPGEENQEGYLVYAQSWNRLINPGMDNHGFARWVWDNAEQLVLTLGEGLHFGEWWGSGIQRGYGLPKGEKHFSLFNVKRWQYLNDPTLAGFPSLHCVPVLYRGPFSVFAANCWLNQLKLNGSYAAPGFMRPEGIVVYHVAGNLMFQATIENDEVPKSMVKEEAPNVRIQNSGNWH